MASIFSKRVTDPSTSAPVRLLRGMWRQGALNPVCPETPRLDGQLALVTGGHRGIGLETSRGLASRGAEVLAASRTQSGDEVPGRFVKLDLSDLESVARCIRDLASEHDGISDFGEQVIRRMNELGIMVDISHASKAAALEALDLLDEIPNWPRCFFCYGHRLLRAQVLANVGRDREAAELLDRMPWERHFGPASEAVVAAFERGRVHERLGNREEAIRAYSYVVDAWRPR